MTATLTGTPNGSAPPRVQLVGTETSTGDITSMTIFRVQGTDPNRYQLYSGAAIGSAWSLDDLEAPFGVVLTYWVEVDRSGVLSSSNVVTTKLTPNIPQCWISDRASGVAMPITVVRWNTRTLRARGVLLAVIDRADPIVLAGKHLMPEGEATFATFSDSDLQQLQTILTATGVVVFRPDVGCSMRWGYQAVGDIGETRIDPSDCDSWRFLTPVQLQQVGALPGAARVAPATLQKLADKNPPPATLLNLNAKYATLLDMSLDPLL